MAIDVLVVSGGDTTGWRVVARELADAVARAGASVEVVTAEPSPAVRTFALTDFVQARKARQAALRGIAAFDPRTIVYCSVTAALLWPRPGAITFDSIAAENRPGRHGVWQRPVERRRLRSAPLLLVWSARSLEPLRGPHAEALLVPVPVEGSAGDGPRDIAAVTYAGDPVKRRLPLVLEAWSRARRSGETLVVVGGSVDGGVDGVDAVDGVDGVEVAGRLPAVAFHALLGRARVFVAAPRREDYGISALEALARGCMLASTPSPGPYPALDIARSVDPRLVSEDLAAAVRIALDDPVPEYASRAAELLAPYRREAVDRAVAEEVLPRLLPGFSAR